jgi:hypothetical protein
MIVAGDIFAAISSRIPQEYVNIFQKFALCSCSRSCAPAKRIEDGRPFKSGRYLRRGEANRLRLRQIGLGPLMTKHDLLSDPQPISMMLGEIFWRQRGCTRRLVYL